MDKQASIQKLFKNINLDEDTLLKIESFGEMKSFPKTTTILNIGETQNYVYLIIKGLARSYYIDEKGNDITKLFMKENEILMGEASF